MKTYPLPLVESIFTNKKQTFKSFGIKINPSLEGIKITPEILLQKSSSGLKKLLSLEFNWLPSNICDIYNTANKTERKEILINKVYSNCKLNCKGCYVKQDNLFTNHKLLKPNQILSLIEESVNELGTISLKYLGPSEFFRDSYVFSYLDRFKKLNVILNIFAKDPMFGDDNEVAELFSNQGLDNSEQFIKKLSSYPNLRILYNFRSFDDNVTNNIIRDGYPKKNYSKNYKIIQNRSLELLYKYFVKQEIDNNKAGRLVILNTPITNETISEAFEIFRYFIDRAVPVCSTASMQSGCGGNIYSNLDKSFIDDLSKYYANAINYSIHRGLISYEEVNKYGPSPYAGIKHCIQLCNGLMIRSTGQLTRCPGADHTEWQDNITPEELIKYGLTNAWSKTKNFQQNSKINVGCQAKPNIFTEKFNNKVMGLLKQMQT